VEPRYAFFLPSDIDLFFLPYEKSTVSALVLEKLTTFKLLMETNSGPLHRVADLETAVKLLILVVHDVERMAFTTMEQARKDEVPPLSIDQRAAIMLYTMEWMSKERCLYHLLF
jgi:hypothetical protein